MKKDLENQIGSINEDLKNIYLPLDAVLILLGKRTAFRIALETLIPELKESEDERIRKWLIDYFKNVGNTWIHREISPEQILSYLEKQKDHFRDDTKMVEQKPADDKAFEKWIDDWWKHNKVNNPDSYDKGDEIQFDKRGFKNFCRGIRNMYAEQSPAEWGEKDEKMIKSILFVLESYVSHSESASSPSLITTYPTYYKEIDWLKSLRPQWRPSEEQMEALKKAYEDAFECPEGGVPHLVLQSLLSDLQKLM